MPLVTITVRKPKDHTFKSIVLEAIHTALVSIGVPEKDLFQRVFELDAENFRYDSTYPDVSGTRDENFILIEILMSVGRSVKIKKQFLNKLMELLKEKEFNPENVMVVFKETNWENWSFSGGRLIHV